MTWREYADGDANGDDRLELTLWANADNSRRFLQMMWTGHQRTNNQKLRKLLCLMRFAATRLVKWTQGDFATTIAFQNDSVRQTTCSEAILKAH
jgi:hypothetical protein